MQGRQDQGSSLSHVLLTRVGDVHVVTPETTTDVEAIASFREALAIAEKGTGPVLVDFDDHGTVSASMVAAVFGTRDRLNEQGRALAICAKRRFVRLLFSLVEGGLQVHDRFVNGLLSLDPGAKRPLGQILVSEHGLDPNELFHALKHQQEEGGLLGRILLARRLVTPWDLAQALSGQACG